MKKKRACENLGNAVCTSIGAAGANGHKDVIDGLFNAHACKKKRLITFEKGFSEQERDAPSERKQLKDSIGSKHDLFGHEEQARLKTEEGWNVYTEEELGIRNQGGNTDLCPFDCECCF